MNDKATKWFVAEVSKLTKASYRQGSRDVVVTFLEIYDQFGAENMVAGMRQFLAENPSILEDCNVMGGNAATRASGETSDGGS